MDKLDAKPKFKINQIIQIDSWWAGLTHIVIKQIIITKPNRGYKIFYKIRRTNRPNYYGLIELSENEITNMLVKEK